MSSSSNATTVDDFTTPPPSPRNVDKPDPNKWGSNTDFWDPAACRAPRKGPALKPPTPDNEKR